MRGLVKEVAGPSGLVYHTDLPMPQIEEDEVLIRVHCTAICGSDLHMLEWDPHSAKTMTRIPVTMGHETAGDIVAVGSKVTQRKVGDRVSVETHIPCGKCYFCTHGMPHICQNLTLFGVVLDGAFAEYTKVRWDATFPLADGISYEMGCLFEPMGAGVHGAEVAEVAGKNVLVSGCGPIGLTAVSACKVFGARRIIACDLVEEKLQKALSMGADVAVNSKTQDLVKEVQALTDGLGVDAVVEVSGSGTAINNALKSLRAGGKLVGVGLPSKPVAIDLTDDVFFREVQVTGVSGRLLWQSWEDFSKVMQSPYYPAEQMIYKRYLLEDYEEAFAEARKGVPGKILLYPHKEDFPG